MSNKVKYIYERACKTGNFNRLFIANLLKILGDNYTVKKILYDVLEKRVCVTLFYAQHAISLSPTILAKKGVIEALNLTVEYWRDIQYGAENLSLDSGIYDTEIDIEDVSWVSSWGEGEDH